MNRFAFLIGIIITVVVFKLMTKAPVEELKRPLALQNIPCSQANTKDSLVRFSLVSIYQLCLPSNTVNGVKNLNIEVYFTASKLDCENTSQSKWCEVFSKVSLLDDRQHQVYVSHDDVQITPNSLFGFSITPKVPSEPIVAGEYQFELNQDDIHWPSGLRPVAPIICDTEALRPWGQDYYVECWAMIERFGRFFTITYQKSSMSYREKFEYSHAANELNRWFDVMSLYVVKNSDS